MKRLILFLALAFAVPASAATRLEFPGGWYAEAQPNGSYVVAYRGGGLYSSVYGNVPSPEAGDGILYVRMGEHGDKFAGQSHAGLGSWEWNGVWFLHANPAFGVSGLIYDHGTLRFAVPGVTGSQGFRYIDDITGLPVTGDVTYADPARRIWEYTTHGDVTIGQGENGCIALRGTDRRTLEPGDCRFVRFNRQGDTLAVAMVKLPERKTVLIWFDVSELGGFPVESVATPPSPTLPPGLPTPVVPASEIARAQAALAQAAFKRDTPTLPILATVAAVLGRPWGLNGKRGNAADPSRDVLAYDFGGGLQPQLFDVIGDAWDPATGKGENRVGWQALEYPQAAGAVWVDPLPFVTMPAPSPDPTVAQLKARVATLERQVTQLSSERDTLVEVANHQTGLADAANARAAELEGQLASALQERDVARERVRQLEAKPAATCTANIPGWLRALGVRGSCTVVQ